MRETSFEALGSWSLRKFHDFRELFDFRKLPLRDVILLFTAISLKSLQTTSAFDTEQTGKQRNKDHVQHDCLVLPCFDVFMA